VALEFDITVSANSPPFVGPPPQDGVTGVTVGPFDNWLDFTWNEGIVQQEGSNSPYKFYLNNALISLGGPGPFNPGYVFLSGLPTLSAATKYEWFVKILIGGIYYQSPTYTFYTVGYNFGPPQATTPTPVTGAVNTKTSLNKLVWVNP
jgi:hypothetical protein